MLRSRNLISKEFKTKILEASKQKNTIKVLAETRTITNRQSK